MTIYCIICKEEFECSGALFYRVSLDPREDNQDMLTWFCKDYPEVITDYGSEGKKANSSELPWCKDCLMGLFDSYPEVIKKIIKMRVRL